MNKVFRYSYKVGYPMMVIAGIFFGLMFYGFFMDAYSLRSNGYMVTVCIIFGELYYLLFDGFKLCGTKITLNDDALIVNRPFKKQHIYRWRDIKEFGRYKQTAPYSNKWFFYFKTANTKNEKIVLFSELIENGQDLVDTIFLKAVKAQFVVIRNTSSIPFARRIVIENWNESKVMD